MTMSVLPGGAQFENHFEQLVHVGEMQAGRWLGEDAERGAAWLRLSSAASFQRCGRASWRSGRCRRFMLRFAAVQFG